MSPISGNQVMAVLVDLVPSGVALAALTEWNPDLALLPEEAAALGRVAEVRYRDFTMGRCCARAALAKLGNAQCAILRGADREPLWPANTVGSITHYRGFAAAAVANETVVAGIGIDAEPHLELPPGVLERIARIREMEWIRRHECMGIAWGRVLFSIKESVFKAWFPLAKSWLGFEDAEVLIDPQTQTFEVGLLAAPLVCRGRSLTRLEGRFAVDEARIITAVALKA